MNASQKRLLKLAQVWNDSKSLRDACKKAGYKTSDYRNMLRYRRASEELTGETLEPHNEKNSTHKFIECPSDLDLKQARKCKDFVITSVTNNSPLVKPFLESLRLFAESRKGQLLVVPVRYQNKDMMDSDEPYSWDEKIYRYALTKDLNIGSNLVISAHRMRATTINPLSGKQALSGEKSAIYGHPQLAMELVGTPKNETPKVMMTTGSCNHAQYSASDAGGKANFYHTVYAVYVKKVGKNFHYTQLGWDGGGFYYLNEYWTDQGMIDQGCQASIAHGDSHVWYEMPKITNSKLRLIEKVNPVRQYFHDLHDHHIGSHHSTLRERAEQALNGDVSVEKEVRMSIDYLERIGSGTENYIVGSNHNDHLDQWWDKFKATKDPYNIKFHGWLSSVMLGSKKSALECCFDEWGCSVHYDFIDRNSRHSEKGIDMSQHGDKGTNGSRGSAKGFAKTTLKSFIGHSHTPCIEKGCWQLGTSTDGMSYANGYSTWMLTDGLIYPNGKRALISHINGKTLADY